jgi:AraC-type DNA-binding domain-containing proteins
MSYTIPVTKNTTEDPAFLFGTEMVSYINAHFQNKLSLQDVSHHFGYSSEYYSRNFKKILGINFKELLTSIRLNYAYDKIINSNDTLEEIALAAGFSTYRNMYNSFVKSYHTTPSQLRAKEKFK